MSADPNTHLSRSLTLASLLVVAVVISVIAYGGLVEEPRSTAIPLSTGGFPSYSPYDPHLQRFTSYQELTGFLSQVSHQQSAYYERIGSPPPPSLWDALVGGTGFGLKGEQSATAAFPLAGTSTEGARFAVSSATSIPAPYSTTNIQVAGVDEADIVKTDGEYLYLASGRNLTILKAYPPEEARVLSRITLNGSVIGVFINGERLVVIYNEWRESTPPPLDGEIVSNSSDVRILPYHYVRTWSGTKAEVFDVSDRVNPVFKRDLSFEADYAGSRMIDDYIYLIVSRAVYSYATGEVALPTVLSGETPRIIPASEIYYSKVADYSYTFTTIAALNMLNDEENATLATLLLGGAESLYVSRDNIYLAFSGWRSGAGGEGTLLHRIHIINGSITPEASGEVQGRLLNQFSMDEYQGYFRVATTTGWGVASGNHVYVLDMNLAVVGGIEDLAPGERIYSARFMGEKGYLVTFRQTDPLFVLDLFNPTAPRVLGKLKIPGYSDYLHPYDENHLIGVGREAGVKISLFNVTDVENPTELAKFEIGDWRADSPVLRDHKAFLFEKSKNLLVIPILSAETYWVNYTGGAEPSFPEAYVWQGAYVFAVSPDLGLQLRGQVTHLDGEDLKGEYYYNYLYEVKRALYIGDVLYTISEEKVKMNNLENLAEINQVRLS